MDILTLEANLKSMSEDELDAILERREEDAFDSAWCQAFDRLTELLEKCDSVDVASMNVQNKEGFIRLSNATQQHEIVSYIVEDWELLTKAELAGFSSEFIAYLSDCYSQGKVPDLWQGN